MNLQSTCWPTPEQELLLQAALLQKECALHAWEQWQSVADIDDIDAGSFRLLPLLYRNLSTYGIVGPIMSKLKGIYRQAWYSNQVRFHQMAILLRALEDAGTQTLLLKGAALAELHYQDYGSRPMSDFDFLVPAEKTLATIDLLSELGWHPIQSPVEGFTDLYFSRRHSHKFVNADDQELDLHWHVLYECCYAGADRDFWDGAVEVKVRDVETRALGPADQLLHVCAHGAVFNIVPPIRWVADAMVVLRTSEVEMDWQRLVTQAEQRRLILQMRGTLDYLKRALNAPIPTATLDSLNHMPVSRVERMEYEANTGLAGTLNTYQRLWSLYVRWERGTDTGSLQPKFRRFPQYLQRLWSMEHLWQVPVHLAARGAHKICHL